MEASKHTRATEILLNSIRKLHDQSRAKILVYLGVTYERGRQLRAQKDEKRRDMQILTLADQLTVDDSSSLL